MPADVTGTRIIEETRDGRRELVFVPGPIFAHVAARRRDQPRHAEDAVGAARGDGRAAGDGRRHDAPAAVAVLRARDAEPDRDGGHLPAARGAARPLPLQGAARVPVAGRARAHPRHDHRGRRARRRARCSTPRRRRRASPRCAASCARCWSRPHVERYVAGARPADRAGGDDVRHRAPLRRVRREPARRPGAAPRRQGDARSSTARPHVTPDDVDDVAHAALRHRLVLRFAAEAAGVDAHASSTRPRGGRGACGHDARRARLVRRGSRASTAWRSTSAAARASAPATIACPAGRSRRASRSRPTVRTRRATISATSTGARSARLDALLVRRFTAEREVPFHLLLDASASMSVPADDGSSPPRASSRWRSPASRSRPTTPSDVLRLGADGRSRAPRSDCRRTRRRVAELLCSFAPPDRSTSAAALEAYAARHRQPGAVFVVSDFMASPTTSSAACWRSGRGRFAVVLLHVIGARRARSAARLHARRARRRRVGRDAPDRADARRCGASYRRAPGRAPGGARRGRATESRSSTRASSPTSPSPASSPATLARLGLVRRR